MYNADIETKPEKEYNEVFGFFVSSSVLLFHQGKSKGEKKNFVIKKE